MDLNNYNEAIILYDESLKIDPNDTFVLINNGIALSYLKKYEEAIVCYDNALRIDPNDTVVLRNKGITLNDL